MGILSTTTTREAETITDGEGEILLHILNLMRSPAQKPWLSQFFWHIAIHGGEKFVSREVTVGELMGCAVNAVNELTLDDSIGGWLFSEAEQPIGISEQEYLTLARYLAVRRSDHWLGGFIEPECMLFEQGRRRTPLEVVRSLEDEIQQFQCFEITTRMMLRNFGGLFAEEIEALKTPAKEPAAPLHIPEERLPVIGEVKEQIPAVVTKNATGQAHHRKSPR